MFEHMIESCHVIIDWDYALIGGSAANFLHCLYVILPDDEETHNYLIDSVCRDLYVYIC